MLKAQILIEKSFDDDKAFEKEWNPSDFKEFFEAEGKYLDKLAVVAQDKGNVGNSFTVVYTVSIVKEK